MIFQCERCGCCCRQIGFVVEAYQIDFPYEVREDGSCGMLSEENLCKVYDNRPLICNVKDFAEFLKIDEEEFYILNKEGCLMLKTL